MEFIKCCLVGNSDVGKTSLCITYTSKQFPSHYIPTVFDESPMDREIDGVTLRISLWDTADNYEYYRLRMLSYRLTDVFLISFSLIDPYSFENVKEKWSPAVTHFNPNTPKILVGTKLDLRDDEESISLIKLKDKKFAPISYSQGLEMMRDIGAVRYIECSALTQIGVTQVFEEVMRVAIANKSHAIRKRRVYCKLI
ncbi:hypothetical protein LOD99_609 [Oopsacas minuta]|uniref:Uncharacterized protein n=1 Tax=Oopsacas minuta TaxID=111878 RepID=A0AAV7K9T2_9METZ|nr:hypothetical protein LOD99_609 [Oopsacas minuta]